MHRPSVVNRALKLDADQVGNFFDKIMTAAEKRRVDQWLLQTGNALIETPGPQRWRFTQLIEQLREQGD